MSVEIGQNLLHYRIVEKIGEGGMGVVWKAEDTTLHREVAIKVLPPEVAQDTERLARFEREAKVLASLNHANIASIYGLHQADDVRFLSMELVDGEDLAVRLERGRMAVEDTLGIARQVADALQSAHERGVVHRDLKPANVVITSDGKAKVLDFGLAKALEADPAAQGNPSMSPTLTSQGTVAGMILGTAGYMSPEQARGNPADKRSDVWSFGVVMFEMLCGSRTFHGDSVADTLASVLKLEPDWNQLPADLPRGVSRLLRRCLQKDPQQRLHDIANARIEIDEALAAGPEPAADVASTASAPARPSWMLIAIPALLMLVAGLFIGRTLLPDAPEPPVRRFFLPLEAGQDQAPLRNLAISPDGKTIAYVFEDKLWLRDLDAIDPRPMDGTQGAESPFWSPDGTHVAYHVESKLWRVPIDGGKPSMISDLSSRPRQATWSSTQTISINAGRAIQQVSARGGEETTVHEIDRSVETDLHELSHLPDDRGLLFVVHRKEGPDTLAVWAGGARKTVLQLEDVWLASPFYAPTGHILFTRERNNRGIWALPFSLDALEATGDPFLVVPDGNRPSAAADGTLVYTTASSESEVELVWLNTSGEIEGTIGQSQNGMFVPAVSPDGTKVVVSGLENDEWDLWIHDAVRRTKTRLTFTDEIEGAPSWSPDGTSIFYFHPVFGEPKTIYRIPADGSGEPETIVEGAAPSFSADGKSMAFVRDGGETENDLWSMNLEPPSEPRILLQTEADEGMPRLSPDGRFVAYVSDESGENQIYVKPHPEGAGRWQASVDGGNFPKWNASGERIYFNSEGRLMQVSFSASPHVSLGTPEVFVDSRTTPFVPFRRIGVAPDGKRLVVVRNVEKDGEEDQATVDGIFVVENWLSEFRED
jgi:serine/threonine-protein kinase